ncbi:RrF2 family transcriptional regulator [Rhizobium puerariae]|uniref:RrF2 family transcriptional regulator n=1 Tax=Rhizobium puerariae TaxID=1585791 RepID=A0ABV6AH96_9HYPH
MRITAKTDYALRALIELSKSWPDPLGSEEIAAAQQIPHKYLEAILAELRRTGFVISQRGPGGGHSLRGSPSEISIADVIRAVNGPLTTIRGECPEDVEYEAAEALQLLWIALRVSIRSVLEEVSLADVATRNLPPAIAELTESPEAWITHWYQPGRPSAKRQEAGS